MEERRSNLTSMIGMMLMAIVLLFFFYRNQPTQEQPKNNTTENTQPQQPNNATVPATTIPTDSVGLSKYKETLGAFAYSATLPSAKEGAVTELENSLLKLQVSNKGGQITSLQVKNQKTYNGQPVELIKDKNASFSLELSTADNRTLKTEDLFFEPSLSDNVLSMKLRVSATQYLEYVYTLRPDEYFLDMTVRSVGLSSVLNTSKAPELTWKLKARRMEKSVTYEDRYVQAVVQYEDNRNDKLSAGGEDSEEFKQVKWVDFKQHLFSSFLISDKAFASGKFSSKNLASSEGDNVQYTKNFAAVFPLEYTSGELNEALHFFYGPSDYHIFKKYDKQYSLTKAIPLGWGIFGWINKWFVIPVFDLLSSYMSMGLAIIVLTIIVRILLSPIQYKSYLSQAKMKVLRPEIEEINEKYKGQDNAMKRQQETMALYSKAGVNPLSGCIPALLQMPVFFALFSFFPTAFVLRQKAFLWANDLSSYDSIAQLPFSIPFYGNHVSLFPILASVTMLIYMLMTTGQMQQPQQEGMPNMKFMMYISPVMMLFFFNNYASGLSLYYFISNLITIFIMLAIKYWIIDEKRIHAKIQENKQKPRKEGKFQRKFREMMEQAEAQQRAQQNNKKK